MTESFTPAPETVYCKLLDVDSVAGALDDSSTWHLLHGGHPNDMRPDQRNKLAGKMTCHTGAPFQFDKVGNLIRCKNVNSSSLVATEFSLQDLATARAGVVARSVNGMRIDADLLLRSLAEFAANSSEAEVAHMATRALDRLLEGATPNECLAVEMHQLAAFMGGETFMMKPDWELDGDMLLLVMGNSRVSQPVRSLSLWDVRIARLRMDGAAAEYRDSAQGRSAAL